MTGVCVRLLMLSTVGLVSFFTSSGPSSSQEVAKLAPRKVETLDPNKLEVGQFGRFRAQSPGFYFEVVQIIGDREMIVRPVSYGIQIRYEGVRPVQGPSVKKDGQPICVKGIPTAGLVDEKKVEL